MKGLAFAKDPDGYWIEIISRNRESSISNEYTLAQTMFRVKDPVKSLHFYRDLLGMTLIRQRSFGEGTDWGFSLYFLAYLSDEEVAALPPPESEESGEVMRNMFGAVIELTHNHGTESNPDFK